MLDLKNSITIYKKYFIYVTLILITLSIALAYLYYAAFYYNTLPLEIPLIKADSYPYKIKPKIAGGIRIPNSDKTIYDKIKNKKNNLSKSINILPPPELPLKIDTDNEDSNLNCKNFIDSVIDSLINEESINYYDPIANNLNKNKDLEVGSLHHKNKNHINQSSQILKIIKPAQTDDRLKNLFLNPVKKHKTQKYRLYLGSTYNPDFAQITWIQIQEENKKFLDGYSNIIEFMNIDNNKFLYNILAGEFSNFNSALTICKKLIANQQNCLVVKY